MNKAFPLWLWEDTPSINTPLAKRLLNLINNALSVVDDRVVKHETTKANQTDMLMAITSVSLDEDTGIFTFTRHNGTTVTIDTRLEKVIMNWNFDSETQTLYLILQDGMEMPVDLSAFITNVEFVDSTTIRAVIGTDGKVAFEIIDGSITGSKLEPNYLANAQMAADSASQSATSAEESAVRAESAAERAEGIAGGDFATNKRVDDIVNGTTQVGDSNRLDGHDSEYFAKNEDLANYLVKDGGGTVYGETDNLINLKNMKARGTIQLLKFDTSYLGELGKIGFAGKDNPVVQLSSGYKNLHHDGNSAKVVKSASAPSDTSAIWIDTTNKLVKAYIDGAWTVI